MPYGSKEAAYSGAKSLAYLTAEQALADYATLLVDLKHNMSSEDSPVVLFGGSYAGSKIFIGNFQCAPANCFKIISIGIMGSMMCASDLIANSTPCPLSVYTT